MWNLFFTIALLAGGQVAAACCCERKQHIGVCRTDTAAVCGALHTG